MLLLCCIGALACSCQEKNSTPVLPAQSKVQWDTSYWEQELLAQSLDKEIHRFWGWLRSASSTPLGSNILTEFPFKSLEIGGFTKNSLTSRLYQWTLDSGQPTKYSFEELIAKLKSLESQGIQLHWSEWRLTGFKEIVGQTDEYQASIDVRWDLNHQNSGDWKRLTLQCKLISNWVYDTKAQSWLCSNVHIESSHGISSPSPPLFQKILERKIPPTRSYGFIDPLIIRDIDKDGFPEILLGTRNLRLDYRAGEDKGFSTSRIQDSPDREFANMLLGDFNNDGFEDIVGVDRDGLHMVAGLSNGSFAASSKWVWRSPEPVWNPLAMVHGDVDGDGDFDIWLGQYKIPFNRGQMPTPVYDANDGFPSYFLENVEGSEFRERKILKKKRRNYSAILADWDLDSDIDLMTLNDFAGIDYFENQGNWNFTDRTKDIFDNPTLFAMGHGLNDWNNDNSPDLLGVGMKSPVATRISGLKSFPDRYPSFHQHVTDLNFGNRLYLSSNNNTYKSSSALSRDVADAGWAWGISSPDYNLDGWADFYFSNGHVSRKESWDYDNKFWTRDIWIANSEHNKTLHEFFVNEARETIQQGHSYGGYFANRFYINSNGEKAIEAGWPIGLSLAEDSRNVLYTDLDNDGDHDMVVLTMSEYPEKTQAVHVFENTWNPSEKSALWYALHFEQSKESMVPIGSAIRISNGSFQSVRYITSLDSYRSQPEYAIRFAIPKNQLKETIDLKIKLPDGRSFTHESISPRKVHKINVPRKQ